MTSRLETLQYELSNASTQQQRLALLHEICWYCAYDEAAERLNDYLNQAQQILSDEVIPSEHHIHHKILNTFHLAITTSFVEALEPALEIVRNDSGQLHGAWRWRVHFVPGYIHSYLGNSSDAMIAFREVEAVATQQYDVIGQFCAWNGIAFAYTYMDNQGEALVYFQRSLAAAKQAGEVPYQYVSTVKLSHTYAQKGDLTRASAMAHDALELAKRTDDARRLGFARARIASVLLERQQYEQAEALIADALDQLPDTADNWHPRTLLYRHLAKSRYFLEKYDASIATLVDLLDQARSRDDRVNMLEILEELSAAYQQSGDFQRAYQVHRDYFDLYRQFQDEKNQNKIQTLETLHQTREAETALQHQKALTAEALQREEVVRREKLKTELANQAKDRFIAKISHELRTPLNAILGFAELVQADATVSPKSRGYLRYIYSSGNDLARLINDLLDVSRMQLEQFQINEQPHELRPLVMEIARVMVPAAQSKGLHLNMRVASTVPVWLQTDGTRLRQIMTNLVDNAIKYTDAGQVELSVEVIEQAFGEELLVQVMDTGIGIPDDRVINIFEAFATAQQPTNATGGVGLGLYITQTLVELLGGKITAVRRETGGSVFEVRLPLKRVGETDQPNMTEALKIMGVDAPEVSHRVMVIDDVEVNAKLLHEWLGVWGFDANVVLNSSVALDRMIEWKPDLILLDLFMPGVSGFEIVQQVRAHKALHEIPVVAITASGIPTDHEAAINAGCDAVLTKPVSANALAQTLASLLSVEFTYHEMLSAASDLDTLSAVDFRGIPTAQLRQLQHVCVAALPDDALMLIAELEPDFPHITQILRRMVHAFRLDEIAQQITIRLEDDTDS